MSTEGVGVRAAKARQRRIVGILAIAGACGGVAGFFTGFFGDRQGSEVIGTMPPAVAIAMTVVLAAAMLWASRAYLRAVDEVERLTNYWASVVTLYFYMIA